ncbi:ATP-binding protein [Photorhabdus sp. SF281]|uniref:ATP-binding protein n=1 Tax=Photorhabdus sp. SF281 TaxID=3459527 RepID=UPI004044EC30
MTDHTLSADSLFHVGQIRLAELSVYNWGSFNGLHTALIDPMGTLVTGDNGAGKSTFIDGLMALLLPAGKATFNVAAAQGDRSDRTLLSYMRGSFGSAHDGAGTRVRSKRESGVVTGLRALYQGDDGSKITLAALFWITKSTNVLADVTRVYVVAKRDLTLKEMLNAFGEGNARAFKQWLRDDPAITCCDDNFSDYQELYRKLLYMDNKNAPALLSRALGLKKIDDLTGLIRELVLEPSTVKDDAKKVVEEFADLVAIHSQLVDARAQQVHLSRLPELSAIIEKTTKEFEELTAEKNSLPVYFGEIFAQLWSEKIADIEAELEALSLKIKQAEGQKVDADKLVERRHEEYLQFGGDKIESLRKEMGHTQDQLNRVVRISSQYQTHAKDLALPVVLEEPVFLKNQSEASARLASIQRDEEEYQDRFATISAKFSELQANIHDISQEIQEIEARPDSNIDVKYQQLRDELVNSLELSKDQCVFIGELIDVEDHEKIWQGAIERALGGLRTTLAVPHHCYSMVTRWLNARHTGLHVRVQVVNDAATHLGQSVEFKPDGYLRKLVWRTHPYREWLKHHLQRFDLQCVSNTEELDQTPFSMTQQGLMHMDKGRFEKKDQHRIDDRRRWCLGFSNKSRLAILNNDKKDLGLKLEETGKKVSQARQDLNSVSDRKILWEKLQSYRWDDINAPYWHEKLSDLQADLKVLEQSGGDLDKARERWESAKEQLAQIQSALNQLNSDSGGVKNTLRNAQEEWNKARAKAEKGLPDSARQLLAIRVGVLNTNDLSRMAELVSKVEEDLDRLLDSSRNNKDRAERSAISIMVSFRSNDKWQVFTVDWQSDIGSLPDYLNHLQQLEEEGLPNLVEQFIERLNKHATQSLARIKTKLESEREDILERIDIINRVLKRTEFRSGTHLKLGSKREKFPHVNEFEQHLRKVLSQVTSDDHEARFRQLAKVVEILGKASAPGSSNTLESLRLLDPRYQMSFYAEELDINTGEIRDVLESSSGKSGGEKESFAATIVAASLAYVLTPVGYDRPVYCTVFLDEAFSNTAETVSRRVLRVFRELHIHVNLITPYKNLNLARESARSLLIAERDQENHDSHLCEVTWEEIDRRIGEEKEKTLAAEASGLGIELEKLV